MKLTGINLKLSSREAQGSYTALVAPTGGAFSPLVGGELVYTAPFLNALGQVDLVSPTTAVLYESININDVDPTATSVEVFYRLTNDTSQQRKVGNAAVTSGNNWAYPIGYEAVQVGIDLGAVGSPWENVEVSAKITSNEGVQWLTWIPFTISHYLAWTLPWPSVTEPPKIDVGFQGDCVTVNASSACVGIVGAGAIPSGNNTTFDIRCDVDLPAGQEWNASGDPLQVMAIYDANLRSSDQPDEVTFSRNNSGSWFITVRSGQLAGDDYTIDVTTAMSSFFTAMSGKRAQFRLVGNGGTLSLALYYRDPTVVAQRLALDDDTNWQTIDASIAGWGFFSNWDFRSFMVGMYVDPWKQWEGDGQDRDIWTPSWHGTIYGFYFVVDGVAYGGLNDVANVAVTGPFDFTDWWFGARDAYYFDEEIAGAECFVLNNTDGVTVCFFSAWS